MRTLPLLFITLALNFARPTIARAEPVLFLGSESDVPELYGALDMELRAFGIMLARRPAPGGFTPEAHAAAATSVAAELYAAAAVWIEGGEPLRVRAVQPSTGRVFEAPLPEPISEIDPRMFAAVAGSVVLEALGRRGPRPIGQDAGSTPSDTAEQPEPARGALAASAAPAQSPLAAPQWSSDARADAQPPAGNQRRRRVFLKAAPMISLAYLSEGHTPDRTPASLLADVDRGARNPATGDLDTELLEELLRRRGYACDASQTTEGLVSVTNCTVAVDGSGFVPRWGVETSLGVQWQQASLALTLRITPDAGEGLFAHALLGVQGGWLLTRPRDDGLWVDAVAGMGFGQIQVRPESNGGSLDVAPYVSSGLGEVRAGLQFGYRFTPAFGPYAGMVAHWLFPNGLFVLDPSLGLEVRL